MNAERCQLFEDAVKAIVPGARGGPCPAIPAPDNCDLEGFHIGHIRADFRVIES
jgi:hypothetical protein